MFGCVSRYRDPMLSVSCCSAVQYGQQPGQPCTWSRGHVCAPVCGLSAQCIMWCVSVLPECAYI